MSSFSLAHGLGITAACVAGGGALAALFFAEDLDGDDDASGLFDKYDKNDDGTLSAAEVRAVRKDFKAGRLTKTQLKTLTNSSGSDMQSLIVAGVVAALILLILLIFGRRIWANIKGVSAPKARNTAPERLVIAPERPRDLVMAPTQSITLADQSQPKPEGPKKLEVKIHGSSKLHCRMHFTHDKPYISVSSHEAGHQDTSVASMRAGSSQTDSTSHENTGATVTYTNNHKFVDVDWDERLVIGCREHPWTPNDELEFQIRSQGLFNSKLMGKGHLSGSQLSSGRWSGDIRIAGPSLSTSTMNCLSVTVTALPALLLEKWDAATDKDGNIYYYNSETGKSQWTAPTTKRLND